MLKFSFRQQVLAGFGLSVILVFIVGILSYHSIHQLQDDNHMVDHTQQVIRNSTNLLQYMIDAETGMRGYVATEKKVFLDPYNAALPDIKQSIDSLHNLIADNPIQVRRIDSIQALVDTQLNILKINIDTRKIKSLDYMVQNNMLLNGKHVMDAIRLLDTHIIGEESRLLEARKSSSRVASTNVITIIAIGSGIFLVIIIVLFLYIQSTFNQQKKTEAQILKTNTELEKVLGENEFKNWLLTGTGRLGEEVQGEKNEKELSKSIITEACIYVGAQVGTLYLYNEKDNRLDFMAGYAFHNVDNIKKQVKFSEGWIGQSAEDRKAKMIKGKINDSLELESSIIKQETESFILPFFFEKKLKGVFEIGFNNGFDKNKQTYLEAIAEIIGIAINTAQSRTLMHELFEETQQQAEELESQQEEMRVTNEELMKKTEMLQASEEELRVQQEELRHTNSELEEKASLLEEKNQAIEEARKAIGQKMAELEATGKYKSEFLANMSHELRTPLNSILVLARILKDNKPANLSDDQIKYASVIFNAGNDLLTLINDILDLSKIESGKMDLQIEKVSIAEIVTNMELLFAEVARNKNITYTTVRADAVPKYITTDQVRVEQIVKNLLSNAFKFTPDHGSVSINLDVDKDVKNLSIKVKDSGIGIPADKQKLIFEAFQQVDGSTSRKYGGTGLGLSISRELAAILGAHIKLESTPEQGSEFTLVIPLEFAQKMEKPQEVTVPTFENLIAVTDTKPFNISKPLDTPVRQGRSEPLVVIVEDDKNFALILEDYAKQHGYQSILLSDGTHVFETVKENAPDAIILDIMLPGKDGWQILRELKADASTNNIPVHLMSAGDATVNKARNEGAINFMKKPIDAGVLDQLFGDMASKSGKEFKQILLIEDHQMQSFALKELMEKQGITVDQAFNGETAFKMINDNDYQCVILDINLPDISGLDLLDKIKENERFADLPVVINTAMELDKTSVSRLMQYANAMVVKNNKSSERLIDEVNLFLNKINSMADHPYQGNGNQRKVNMYLSDKSALKNKKVLIVDDDMRNIFALSSALESYDFIVDTAYDGKEAIAKLEGKTDIDIVLMDIMMPVMDGYDAMREIRRQPKWNKLPMIALTAKAMKEDREKCIVAGANDYITKPVDIDRLIALMQIWLEK